MNTEVVAQVREYKYTKECYLKIRDLIKESSQKQRELKPQRKCDENLRIPRTISQHQAIDIVRVNKYYIRLYFVLYDEVRGKDERVKKETEKLSLYQKKDLIKLKDKYLKEIVSIS
jgi:hypothetical protein